MAKLITVIGNVGVGKTTFARQLCAATGYGLALERHDQRAFHAAFAADGRALALANQIDFLLLRVEQEQEIRRGATVGVTDGGLEQDFQVFTRYFYQTGRLSPAEYDLCHRLYQCARQMLPPPDVIVALDAPDDILISRFKRRNRTTEVIQAADIPVLAVVVRDCFEALKHVPTICVNAAVNDPGFVSTVAELRPLIQSILGH